MRLAGVAFAAGCATSPDAYYASLPRCAEVEPDAVAGSQCLAVRGVREYLERAQQRVFDTWELPRDESADQMAKLIFRLRSDGAIQCLTASPDPTDAYVRSVVSALERATPFAPLPPEAACLAELPVAATFSNPVAGRGAR